MTQSSEISSSVVKSFEVLDIDVLDRNCENIGKIEEIILDKMRGEVKYLVLSFGGFLGVGEKLFAIPWNSIRYNEKEKSFIMDIVKASLKDAPGFDRNKWPDFADKTFGKKISDYYNA